MRKHKQALFPNNEAPITCIFYLSSHKAEEILNKNEKAQYYNIFHRFCIEILSFFSQASPEI